MNGRIVTLVKGLVKLNLRGLVWWILIPLHISSYNNSPRQGELFITGGDGGIRTHEGLLTLAGFQDRCLQPLGHVSTHWCNKK